MEALEVVPAGWSDEAARWLGFAVHATLDDIALQVETGARLFEVRAGGDLVGAFVLRVDQTASGAEGVIVAAAGKLGGVELLPNLIGHVEGLFQGVRRIRVHTARPGMVRRLEQCGYKASEVVLVKDVS